MLSTALLRLLLFSLTVVFCTGSQQATFGIPSFDQPASEENGYQLKWPVNKVAIIGAGPGGMLVYRELTQAGFQVHVFERDDVPGGNWHYTEETPVDAPIPNADIAVGDYVPSYPPPDVQLPYTEEIHGAAAEHRRQHRAPKPVWDSLTLNAPAPVQQFTELPWPVGTPWELPHWKMRNYMRAFASFHGINSNDNNPNVSYNTRVELVKKHRDAQGKERGWMVLLKELVQTGPDTARATWREEEFDAVVVATGRFNAPNMPSIPGLAELAQRFPDRVRHSRQYRRPEPFANQTVLIVGAALSGSEICREINPWAHKVYQSIRPDNSTKLHFDLGMYIRRLPANTTILPEIRRFLPPAPGADISSAQIELVNGTIVTGVDRIVLATGFRYSFPFLPQYHNASVGPDDPEDAPRGAVQPLVTDGTHVRALHLDCISIAEPTLAFINMNTGTQTFTYAEYLALALAKVWARTAFLPPAPEMWRLHAARVRARGGYGRHLQFLGAARLAGESRMHSIHPLADNVRFLVAWLNGAAVRYGGRQIDSLPKGVGEAALYWTTARFGTVPVGLANGSALAALGLDPPWPAARDGSVDDERVADQILFNDWW
ncbi:hypothetical protein B0H21DRAFT_695998 [Amylocystis lapponica]|nr:hypothetical protein B0H21DRAFT_695998 [Amylocystis lapponica]